MRVAALDLGSNTSLLLIAEVEAGVIQRVISDETTVTKMGQGVHLARRFHPDALNRVRECLRRYRKSIDAAKVDRVMAVATSAARDVENRGELVAVCREFDIPVEIISGEREAAMTFRGAVSDIKNESHDGFAVIDVGGGSTEVIVQDQGQLHAVSVDVGSVRLTELFVTAHPIVPAEIAASTLYAETEFSKIRQQFSTFSPHRVIGVAGTPTTLAALEWNEPFSESKVHGFALTSETVSKWIATMAPMSLKEREKFRGLQPQRADVIVMGAITLRAAMQTLKCRSLTVSVRGIRYGLAIEMAA